MIQDFINSDLKALPIEGLDIHIIKKYIVKTSSDESFTVQNLSILLIKSGSFKIQLKEFIQDLSARDLIIIPKDSFCTIFEIQEKLQLFLISFSSEFAVKNCLKKELIESFYFFIKKQPLKVALEEKEFLVLSLIYKLIYFVNKDVVRNGFDFELQRISFNLFLYELKLIYSKYFTDEQLNFSRKENLVIQFLTVLSIHCRKQHNVKFYAGVLFITSGYLNKVLMSVIGKQAKVLIVESIITEAKSMLEDSQKTIKEIAEELEFSTVSNFITFFKKYVSYSPSEYRSNSIERFKHR